MHGFTSLKEFKKSCLESFGPPIDSAQTCMAFLFYAEPYAIAERSERRRSKTAACIAARTQPTRGQAVCGNALICSSTESTPHVNKHQDLPDTAENMPRSWPFLAALCRWRVKSHSSLAAN